MNWEDVAKKLLEYIDRTKDFILQEAPSFFYEVVSFGRAWLTCLEILCFTGIILFSQMAWKFIKKYNEADKYSDECKYIFPMILSMALFIPSFICFFVNLEPFFMAWFAPKLYLLRKLTGK